MRYAIIGIGAALLAAGIWVGTTTNAAAPATGTATSASPMDDEALKAAAEKIKGQQWASKHEMYAELVKLVRPGNTVAQLKMVLPMGMGIELPKTVKVATSRTNPNSITLDPTQLYAGGTMIMSGGSWGLYYN